MSNDHQSRYTTPFWEALHEGLVLGHCCSACNSVYFPPAQVCPDCGSQDVKWHELTPRGRLYSFSRQHVTPPGFDSPRVIGIVTLTEGPRLLSTVKEVYDGLAIGMPVELQPTSYDQSYERGELSDYPYFEAVPLEESDVQWQ